MKTVWVNGTFDVVHIGHIKLLQYAKSLGGRLTVGLDSDRRVKELKGETRPVNCLQDRLDFMAAIECVDSVVYFDTADELASFIEVIKPDIMVVGEDYIDKPVIGAEFAGEVKYFSKVPGKSTTKILESRI